MSFLFSCQTKPTPPRPGPCVRGAYPPSASGRLFLGSVTRSPTIAAGSLPNCREDFTEASHRSETLSAGKFPEGQCDQCACSQRHSVLDCPLILILGGPWVPGERRQESEFLKTKTELLKWLKPVPPARSRHSSVQKVLSPWEPKVCAVVFYFVIAALKNME